MSSGIRFCELAGLACLVVSVGSSAGCSSTTAARPAASSATASAGAVNPPPLSEEEFAEKAYQVLLEPQPSQDRTRLLVAVVRQQLKRAGARFERDNGNRPGLSALLGAFYLVRAGEHRREFVDGADAALSAGAAEVARLGQEGFSIALYSMLATGLPSGPAHDEVENHLKAILDFSRATQGSRPLQALGRAARVSSQRAMIESSTEAFNSAREQLVSWMRRALESTSGEQPLRLSGDRDEALETYRAMRGGPIVLTALHLRHGDARGALHAIDNADLGRLIPPGLRDHLERAAEERDPDAWAALFRLFRSAAESTGPLTQDPEAEIDTEVMGAAAFGCALELYRAEPATLHGAMPLAAELIGHGMAEVAAVLLSSSLSKNAAPEELSLALSMVLNAAIAENSIGQFGAARRTYLRAQKLFELAESRAFAGKIEPSAARIHYVMAAMEASQAELDRAQPLAERSIALEPSIDAFNLLAAIARQKQQAQAALDALDRVIGLARRNNDALAEVEALFSKFEILRERGPETAAAKALDETLARTVEATRLGRPGPAQARLERLLARILEQYGDRNAIRRASDRAFEAASGDVRQLSATILDLARRALTQGDLQAARMAAQRAIDAGLPAEDLVYVALWLQLLERKLNVMSDGTVEEAYSSIDDTSGWPAKLRSWARGKLSDEALLAAARSSTERTEAVFYSAMRGRLAGKAESDSRLREVASSPAINLIEVAIARDLIAPSSRYKLPTGVVVP